MTDRHPLKGPQGEVVIRTVGRRARLSVLSVKLTQAVFVFVSIDAQRKPRMSPSVDIPAPD